MQQTILDVLAYWETLALPVKHMMYDSWWYWKECGGASNTWLNCRGAVELWEPRTDVFPSGFQFKEPLPLALHNRYFSANNNTYANDLGFASSFIIEKNVDLALPVKADVFTYMMSRAKAWGAVLYEQDWLITVWRGMNVTRSSVTASHDWLAAMAEAATSLGLTIQCVTLPCCARALPEILRRPHPPAPTTHPLYPPLQVLHAAAAPHAREHSLPGRDERARLGGLPPRRRQLQDSPQLPLLLGDRDCPVQGRLLDH